MFSLSIHWDREGQQWIIPEGFRILSAYVARTYSRKELLDAAQDAIGLMRKYRDEHGYDEERAISRALAEVAQGIEASPATRDGDGEGLSSGQALEACQLALAALRGELTPAIAEHALQAVLGASHHAGEC